MPIPNHLQSQLDRELDEGETVVRVAQTIPHALRLNSIGNCATTGFVVGSIASMFTIVGWTVAINRRPTARAIRRGPSFSKPFV